MDKIAIIGLGCRFPGAPDPASFWQLLSHGGDAIREIPADRWDVDTFYDPTPQTPGKMNTRWGGFLEKVDCFDASFFGITPKEAERMDPQHRLVLEVAWECLEDAGLTLEHVDGSNTGVFLGIGNYDYGRQLIRDSALINAYDGIGNTLCIAANRLSYFLNLRGPSLVLESACSSSLVSVHYAVRSLQSGESDLCLAGGVSLMLSPEPTITYAQARMMSSDGHCKTFDASADGYVRGEGCGMVLLRRLSDAIASGDTIYAVISGTAVNQDGRSAGLTAPNGLAQQAVIRQALLAAGLMADQVSYIEAHGTGTPLGDPIEFEALQKVYSQGRLPSDPCAVGSVKTNIGHLEAAAGMAGLIKLVLMLRHRQIPAHLHLHTLNPYIQLEGSPFRIPTSLEDWQPASNRLYAGLSSFGFGGTNAHVIVEESPVSSRLTHPGHSGESATSAEVLVLSARSEQALRELCEDYRSKLDHPEDLSLSDLCGSAATGRSRFDHRFAALGSSLGQMRGNLDAFLRGCSAPEIHAGVAPRNRKRKLAFLLTGQGSQYAGMGAGLYNTEPVFRAAIDRCDAILLPLLDRPLLSVLFADATAEPLLNQTAYTQPALFSLEYALAQLWISWGVQPTLLIGHSLGEYVAAALAGVFSLEDGLKLIARRGQLIQSLPRDGSMVAVWHDHGAIKALLRGREQEISLATINGTSSCVISGRREAIEDVVASLTEAGIAAKPLEVSHAFHSPAMEAIADAFAEVAGSITYHCPALPIVSNLNGAIAGAEMATPEYWCRHLREPVWFLSALEHLVDQRYGVVLEIGPRPTLASLAATFFTECGRPLEALASLRPKRADREQMLESVARLHVLGFSLRWDRIYPHGSFQRIPLATYPFQRERFWLEIPDPLAPQPQLAPGRAGSTPLLELLNQGSSAALTAYLAKLPGLTLEQAALLPALAEALLQDHQALGLLSELDTSCYELLWRLSSEPLTLRSLSSSSQQPRPAQWWVLADQQGVGSALAERLRQQGQDVLLIEEAADPQTRPWADPAAFRAMSSRLTLQVVHLWGLDSLDDDVQHCLQVPLELIRALGDPECTIESTVWIVTQLAVGLTQDSVIHPAQAALWGFAKVLGLEEPDRLGAILDLPGTVTAESLDRLVAVLLHPPSEPLLALRSDGIHVPRLVPRPIEREPCGRWSADHSYLVTGGLGALGLQVAEWLAGRGAGSLVLLSRREPTPDIAARLAALQAEGVSVRTVRADVTDAKAMRELWSELREAPQPLAGVFHCAGLTSYAEIKDLDWTECERILQSKVQGGWLLHSLSKDQPLDCFVCFSSIASVWGSRGQAHYAAANAFLDGLCALRDRQGLAASCINWGPWQGGGMASDAFRDLLSRMGVQPLDPEQALAAMDRLLSSRLPQRTIATIDWLKFRPLYELKARTGLLSELGANGEQPGATGPSEGESYSIQWLRQLEALPDHSRYEHVLASLRSELAGLLGFAEPAALPSQANLFDLGIDSLMAMDILEIIRSKFKTEISFLELVQTPTLQGISETILHQLFPESHAAAVSEPVVRLEEEAVLDPAILPVGLVTVPVGLEAPTLLVTGASGFLGAYLLHDLLQAGNSVIYCLVRPSKDQSGEQRIISNLRRYGLWHQSMAERVIPVAGDLAKPRLGLADEDYQALSEVVEAIYHSAAVLNFVYPYSRLKSINVVGTQEILRFACVSRLKHVHYVSTDAVFDSSEYYDKTVYEQDSILATEGIDLGYTQTKWVSERLVALARDRGVPVTIYRPPLITGDSRTGKWNTEDFTCLFLKGCVQMGLIPDIHADVTFVPVDYVSRAIVALSREEKSVGGIYHLTNPHSTSWHQVAGWIDAIGFPLACVPYEQWEGQLLDDSSTGSNVLSPLLPFFLKRWSAEELSFAQLAERRVRLDSQKTVDDLQRHQISCPVVDKQLITTYFSYFSGIGFVHSSVPA
jgi:thioester reductase-like protein